MSSFYSGSSDDSSSGADARFISVRISRGSWSLSGDIVAEIRSGGVIVRTERKSQDPPVNQSRGPIRGFSKNAQKNLLNLMLGIDIESVAQTYKNAPAGRSFFVTLTYRRPDVPIYERRRHLEAFRKRLEYVYGKLGVVWKLEFQERGTAHYHLMIFHPEMVAWREFRDWCFTSWRSITGDDCYPDVITVYAEPGQAGRLISYTVKYMSKSYKSDLPTGRVWGCWNKSAIPFGPTYVLDLTYPEYVEYLRRLRRVYRRSRYLGSRTANFGGVTVYSDQEKSIKLLRGLGEYRAVKQHIVNSASP